MFPTEDPPMSSDSSDKLSEREYITRKRVDSILTAREQFHHTLKQVNIAEIQGELDQFTARSLLRDQLTAYVTELLPYLRGTDTGERFWSEYEIHTFSVPVPSREQIKSHYVAHKRGENPDDHALPNGEPADSQRFEVVGLSTLYELPNPISVTRSAEFSLRHEGQVQHTMTTTYQPSTQTLLAIFDCANEFCHEVGLDLDLEDADGVPHGKL